MKKYLTIETICDIRTSNTKFWGNKMPFLVGSKVAVGLDISGNVVKLVQLGRQGSDIHLLRLGMARISDDPLDKMEQDLRTGLTADTIKRIISESKIKTKKVYTSISGSSVVVRYIKLPYMSEEELRRNIRVEAGDYIPFDIQDVAIDFQILGQVKEDGEEKIKVLLVAAKNEVVDQHLAILRMARLDTQLINVDTFAIEDAWHLSGDGKENVVALVEIGSTSTNINIIEQNISCFNRDAIIGGNDFTEAVQRELNLDFKKADEIKRESGKILTKEAVTEGKPDEEKISRVSAILEQVAGRLLSELNRSFAYYYTQSHGGSIDRVVLSGGSARLPNLDKFLTNGLGAPVEILNPFAKIKIDTKRFDLDSINEMAPGFAVSVGLAVRGLVG